MALALSSMQPFVAPCNITIHRTRAYRCMCVCVCDCNSVETCVCLCFCVCGPDAAICRESLPYSPSPAITSLGVRGGNGIVVQELVTWSQRPIGCPPACSPHRYCTGMPPYKLQLYGQNHRLVRSHCNLI